MRIAMIGTGYVGLVSGACFADLGHTVTCVDIDPEKIRKLEAGVIPIYEPGLDELVKRNVEAGRLSFTTEVSEAVPGADAAFVAVGTPPRPEDGHADMRYVHAAAEAIAASMTGFTVIVDKSTVPVGTAREVSEIVARIRNPEEFEVVSNPEFLREGAAVDDFLEPDRVVVGVRSERARGVMEGVYKPLTDRGVPLLVTDPESAELIKYAANAFLATKIAFINEIADICERTGANVHEVSRGIGMDTRIGPKFLMPGPGYGGSCFPKDTLELVATARRHGAPSRIVEAVVESNDQRKRSMAERVSRAMGDTITGKTVAVLGLTFKAETDDMRESPSIDIVAGLQEQGAKVVVHDPKGMETAKSLLSGVEWADNAYSAMQGADAAVIVTEWTAYRTLDLDRVIKTLARPVIVDLRNLFDPDDMAARGFTYASVGRVTAEG
ncbi:MAG: UDP-glucose/GDP-mannose dehydrogenase family protein [Alphaproteobacteria bacterium]|nr:UDP-glucose/GDP-mannose dehydrogenase family protein [Alphaproteobacteria bacterium]